MIFSVHKIEHRKLLKIKLGLIFYFIMIIAVSAANSNKKIK